MEGKYTLFDRIVQKALDQVAEALKDKNYSITGGINVQLLIADNLCSRTSKDLQSLSSLEDSFLLRKTGDIDVIVDAELADLADVLFNSSLNLNYTKIDREDKRIDYQLKPERGEALNITFYATPGEKSIGLARIINFKYNSKNVSIKALPVEDLIVQKLDNGREKDFGDVQRLIIVYGSEIDEEYINKVINKKFAKVRAEALTTNYQTIKRQLTENK